MRPTIRPLFPQARVAGLAATVHAVEVDAFPDDPADNYRGELSAVDALQDGDVMVVSTIGQSVWGELLATAARRRGATGIVVDGFTRDANRLIDMEFPTFAVGVQCQDSLGRVDVLGANVPIECGGVVVHPRDLILADSDGVVVVPAGHAEEVLSLAEAKVADESRMRAILAEGVSVTEAFRMYHVL
jgi:regulator of RNase E activity RraA